MDMSINLMRGIPLAHRELFMKSVEVVDGETRNVRKVKETYTMEDLWAYYNLLYYGRGEKFGACTTRRERENRRALVLQRAAPITEVQYDFFKELAQRWGLEVLLMAIETYCSEATDRLPDPQGLVSRIRDAQATYNRLGHRKTLAS